MTSINLNQSARQENDLFQLAEARIRLVDGDMLYSRESISNPDAAAALLGKAFLSKLDREFVVVVNLDPKNRPINYHIAVVGGTDFSYVPMQNLFKSAILSNASNIMLLHNHPSGDTAPSQSDYELTKKLIEAGRLINIPVVDHVIVAAGEDAERYSFREHDPRLFISDQTMAAEKGKAYQAGNKSKDALAEKAERKYPSASDRVKQAMEKLDEGVPKVFESEEYKQFLLTMAKFYHYSLNNQLLIAMQKPDATMIASYTDWQRQFHRQVKKGEKGITIIAPSPYKKMVRDTDPLTGEQTYREETVMGFKTAATFDISQTDVDPLPTMGVTELTGSVQDYDDLLQAILKISDSPVTFQDIPSDAKGFFIPAEDRIVVQEGMGQEQTIKTLIHEITHSRLHNSQKRKEQTKNMGTMEVEAESTAFVVTTALSHFGMDTSEYSFPYIASWSAGKDLQELKSSLQTIRDTSVTMIQQIEDQLQLVQQEHQVQERLNEKQQDNLPEEQRYNSHREIRISM